ncbi:hypothetical protein V3851_17450 [Paenibacillus sp. M1]|uniref:Uncharacterized protein n=1 Tax=Paenibacillus haidiansis TaxID=1574488 RepID=A0ABU7VV71_9BACL
MQWLTAYEQQLQLAFDDAQAVLSGFPEPFRSQALVYLDGFNILNKKHSQNYICYLLPFWLERTAGHRAGDSRRLAVANILGMMYYHLIDACMDEPEPTATRRLPLAEMIHLEFLRYYTGIFPGDSSFWAYYGKYVSEWAEAVSQEAGSDYLHDNPVLMGRKAAPVKLSVAGSMLRAEGGETHISRLEQAVDTVLVTLQLLDDWEDWEKDLQEGSYNSLISKVRREAGIPADHRPTPDEIRQGIYTYGVLSRLSELSNRNHESLHDLKQSVPDLYEFHEFLRSNLEEGAMEIERERMMLTRGGLEYWLSKNMNNS